MFVPREKQASTADRAVALNPNSYLAWSCKGWVYKIACLPEEAVRSFERAIRISPVDPRLHLTIVGMGLAFIELRRFDDAIVAVKESPSAAPLLFDSLPLSIRFRPSRT
jgi:adenylate cyclase